MAYHTRSTSRLTAEQLLYLNGFGFQIQRPARPVSVSTAQPSPGVLDGGDDPHPNNGESKEG